ncbi:MAG: hypothetical protein F7C07_00475 [Desulfurococcales archaeon]|nr:hypothetical protein [Desulfurococcales archaeon]
MVDIALASKIKTRVVETIKELRGLSFLLPSEVKIEVLEKKDEGYIIRGSYRYKGILGSIIEEGDFEVELDYNLNPSKVRIKPRNH